MAKKTNKVDDLLVFDDVDVKPVRSRRADRKRKIADIVGDDDKVDVSSKPKITRKRRSNKKKSSEVEITKLSDCKNINKHFKKTLTEKWKILLDGNYSDAAKVPNYIRGAASAAKVMGHEKEYIELRELVKISTIEISNRNEK